MHTIQQCLLKSKSQLWHSWGGAVAGLYSERFPEKVAKLVLFAAVTQRSNSLDAEAPSYRYESMTSAQRVNAMKELTQQKTNASWKPKCWVTGVRPGYNPIRCTILHEATVCVSLLAMHSIYLTC